MPRYGLPYVSREDLHNAEKVLGGVRGTSGFVGVGTSQKPGEIQMLAAMTGNPERAFRLVGDQVVSARVERGRHGLTSNTNPFAWIRVLGHDGHVHVAANGMHSDGIIGTHRHGAEPAGYADVARSITTVGRSEPLSVGGRMVSRLAVLVVTGTRYNPTAMSAQSQHHIGYLDPTLSGGRGLAISTFAPELDGPVDRSDYPWPVWIGETPTDTAQMIARLLEANNATVSVAAQSVNVVSGAVTGSDVYNSLRLND